MDLGLLTCRPELGADVTDLFNVLTGPVAPAHVPPAARRAAQPPLALPRPRRARDRPRRGRAAGADRRSSSTRSSTSPSSRRSTGRRAPASTIDLIVRGACSLQPGLPGVSERIRVRSIIGEFLEHSRIWSFENGGDREWYIGSADLMDRNLDRRVEAVVPVEDPEAQARLAEIIDVMLADDRRSWQLQPDATWVRTEVLEGRAGHHRHVRGAEGGRARRTASVVATPHRPGAGRRLAGPARMTAATVASAPVEVELKYRVVDLAAAERYLAADEIGPFTRHGRPRSTQLEDRYVDTADGALARAGFAVRLRQTGRGTIVSVKSLARTRAPGGVGPSRGARRPGRPDAPARSTGRRPTPGRWSSSSPATRRSSSS